MARAAAARRDPPSFQQRRAASVLLLLSALGAASSASPPVDTGEELVGVAQLRAFLDESHYVPGEPGAAANHAARPGRDCSVHMVYPPRGYQGDTTSAPRLRQADAYVSISVTGTACVSTKSRG